MSHWEPPLDLMRLLEALANEIAVTTDYEVHQACNEGRSTVEVAQEVRELIAAVNERIDLESSGHRGNTPDPGPTCYRPH